jgi:hypothetical protein
MASHLIAVEPGNDAGFHDAILFIAGEREKYGPF